MARLQIDAGEQALELDDATLLHVSLVLLARLRRGEPFLLRWRLDDGETGSTWIDDASDLRFEFSDLRGVDLDRVRLDDMLRDAGEADGLEILARCAREDGVDERAAAGTEGAGC